MRPFFTDQQEAAVTHHRWNDPHSFPRAVVLAAGATLFSYCCGLVFVAVVLGFWNDGPSLIINGSSMEPSLSRGDIIITNKPHADNVSLGSIVTYEQQGRLVTHRIVALGEDGSFITKGDATTKRDSTPLFGDDIEASARMVVPVIGWPKVWLDSSNWLALIVAFAVLGVSFQQAVSLPSIDSESHRDCCDDPEPDDPEPDDLEPDDLVPEGQTADVA